MGAIAFDTLKFARKLKAAGVPDEQAEAQAEVLAEAFLHNLDEIVTRDHLDARLAEQDARLVELEARLTGRFTDIDGRLRLLFWMQGLVILAVVLLALCTFLG